MATNQANGLKRIGENLYVNDHGTYFAWFSLRGKQIKRSLRTEDKALARRRLADLREKAGRLHGGKQRNIQFEELAAVWLDSIKADVKASTHTRRAGCVKNLTPSFKGIPVRSITRQTIEAWKVKRSGDIAARTFNKELETLSIILRYAKNVKGLLLDNPADEISHRKAPVSTVQIPTKAQFCQLVETLRKEPQAAVPCGAADFAEFLAYSGLRLGEATEVRWRDINPELNTLLVTGGEKGTKNHESRTIPLFPALCRLIERLKTKQMHTAEERIFKLQTIRQALKSACEKSGLPQFTHHAMRHFFCSNAIEAGIDFKAIAGWLGHKDGGVLVARTYGHLRNEHSSSMALKMTFDAVGKTGT